MNREIKDINDEFIVSVYCGPQPPIEVKGVSYPDRVTEEQFKLLKDLGVNLSYGQCDIMNSPTEPYAFKALEICSKIGMGYLVKDQISREYCSLGNPFKGKTYRDYRTLTEEEKVEIDERFKNSILRYKDYPSFKGIIFVDEPGTEMFDGISRASKVFHEVYPEKVFLVNQYPYNTNRRDYQFAVWQDDGKTELRKEFEFILDKTKSSYDGFYVHNNVQKYEIFLDEFFSKVDTNVYSWDLYAFRDWFGYNTLVMRGIYEMPLIAQKFCEKYGLNFWIFLQCGGLWDAHAKVTTFAEVQLSVSLAMALGAKGIQLYTGCFPNDCLPKRAERSGVIDEYGNTTNQYDFYKCAFRQLKAVQKYIVSSNFTGVITEGTYYDRTPDVEGLKALDVTDIYKGKFPIYGNHEKTTPYKDIAKVTADYQVLVSCFEKDGKRAYMVVNTSPVVSTTATIEFDAERKIKLVQAGESYDYVVDKVTITNLPAGENCLIVIE